MLFMLQHVDIFMNITCVYNGIWHRVYIILIYCFLCVLRDFTLCFTFFFCFFSFGDYHSDFPIGESEAKVGAASRCFLLSKVYDFPHPMISSNSVCIQYVVHVF